MAELNDYPVTVNPIRPVKKSTYKQLQAELERLKHSYKAKEEVACGKITKLQAELTLAKAKRENLKDWIAVIKDNAETLCCLADKCMADNTHRLIVTNCEQALEGVKDG